MEGERMPSGSPAQYVWSQPIAGGWRWDGLPSENNFWSTQAAAARRAHPSPEPLVSNQSTGTEPDSTAVARRHAIQSEALPVHQTSLLLGCVECCNCQAR